MPPKKSTGGSSSSANQSSSLHTQSSKTKHETNVPVPDKIDQLMYGDEDLGLVVVDDENKFFDFTLVDKVDPNPTWLKEPALLAEYHRDIQDYLMDIYVALDTSGGTTPAPQTRSDDNDDDDEEESGDVLHVAINDAFFDQIEPLLIDAFVTLYHEAINNAISENERMLTTNHIHNSTPLIASAKDTKDDQRSLAELNDFRANLAAAVTKLRTANPSLATHSKMGSGTTYMNPTRFPPIVDLVDATQFKMDLTVLQPFLHSFNSYPPTTSDIFQPINSSHSTLFHKDRPEIPLDGTKASIKVLSPSNYYISQAILRNYSIVKTTAEIAAKNKTAKDDQELYKEFLTELNDPTFDSKAIQPPPKVTQTQVRSYVEQHAPRGGPFDQVPQYVLFHDSITNNYYNVTNALFTPQKTQLMYLMVIGAPVEMIRTLLCCGASITQTDENGWTALRWACERLVFGRARVYEAFGLIPYLSPDYYRDTLSRNDIGQMVQGRRRLNPVLMGLVKKIQDGQPEPKRYDKVNFEFPTQSQSAPLRPIPQSPASKSFQQDLKLVKGYIGAIVQYTQRHPVSHYHAFLSQLPISPPLQLYDHNLLPPPPATTDPWAIAMVEVSNSHGNTTNTTTTGNSSGGKKGNNDKQNPDKDTTQLVDFLRGSLTSTTLPAFLQKHPYLFTGFRFDYSLPENQDLMMVNASTAVYMLPNAADVTALLALLKLPFSPQTHQEVYSRLNQWYTYPDDTNELKELYLQKIRSERDKVKSYENELVALKAERQGLLDKIELYNTLDRSTTAELAAKRAELVASNTQFEQTNQTLMNLKNELTKVYTDLDSMRDVIKAQTKAHALLLADKERQRLQTKAVEATLKEQQQQLAIVTPTIFQDNGVYHANLIPGVIEPFSLEKSFDKATVELINNVEAKRSELTPFDTFAKLNPSLDVSPANPNPYGLFCELYQRFIVDQPARISSGFDTTFLKEHEQSLFDHFTSYSASYPSQLDFWKQMLAQRAGLLHSAMVRMYQLEQLLLKYREKTFALISDLRSLEGHYAMIVQAPPKASSAKDVLLSSTAAAAAATSTKKVTAVAYDPSIPSNWKSNMCIFCHKEPKRVVTTCCYTMVTCTACQPQLMTCPQCKGKSGPLDTRVVKFH